MNGRRLSQSDFLKAITITTLSLALVVLVFVLLVATQPELGFQELLFETVSAFGTVGLSMGITSSLNDLGRVLIVLTMFAGRVGPATIAFALGRRQIEPSRIRYPEENVPLG